MTSLELSLELSLSLSLSLDLSLDLLTSLLISFEDERSDVEMESIWTQCDVVGLFHDSLGDGVVVCVDETTFLQVAILCSRRVFDRLGDPRDIRRVHKPKLFFSRRQEPSKTIKQSIKQIKHDLENALPKRRD